MDGISAAASAIAVVQISMQAFDLCRIYYLEAKEARNDIQRLRDEVTSLQDVLTNVADLAEDPSSAELLILNQLNQQDGPVQQCQRDLLGLVAKLETGRGKNPMKQFGLKALKWPFSNKDIQKLLMTIGRHKATFNLALTADHVGLSRTIRDNVARLNACVTELQIEHRTCLADGRRQKLHQWLSPPDPSLNHNAACKKRQPTTGEWFLRSDHFEEWKMSPNSFLWLHGIPGCGKTILCSTIAQDVIRHCELNPKVAVAYFYFDFNDREKQCHENLIRSLIVQFSTQSEKTPDSLGILFARSQEGQQQPTIDALMVTLQDILGGFPQVFIILDALDECKEMEELLGIIENIVNWKLKKLHILATSRMERDIEETLEPLATRQICIQSAIINADIQTYIGKRLQNDSKLRKWPASVQAEIEKTLMDGADGMFRWVICQLDALRKCLKLDTLRIALRSLPKTLDDTYARILCNIDEEYSQDAFKILQWLAYSARPLRIEEVAEVVAVEINDSPRFHPENRLLDPRDVLTICSALVTATTRTMQCRLSSNTYEAVELRLAHYSVKEFLLSDRVKTGPASRFCIWKYAEPRIAQTCLAYLLHFERPIPWGLDSVDKFKFPLALYAAEYWPHHARAAGNDMHVINQLCMQLLQAGSNVYMNWIRLFDPDWRYSDRTDNTETIAAPLYYSSLIGLAEPTRLLLELGADVNIQGARYGNALQAASVNGHVTIVRQLVNSGADVNAQAGYWDNTPLAAASSNGHNTIVDYLIESGANVDLHSKKSWTALEAASAGGHETIIQRLLEIGASSGNALSAAARAGHDVIIQLLLKSGAHVGNRKSVNEALRTASRSGHYTICQQLIIAGADINAPGGELGNALQAAALGGEDYIVKLLLEAGAEIDSSTGEEFYGEPWEVWGTAGRPDEVQYYGPGPNSGAGYFGTALQAAAYPGHESTVRLLLTSGANCDIQGGWYNNALHAAAAQGHNAIAQQLLESAADVNIQGGYYGNALQAAAESGHEAMVRLLLENGANVNAKGGVHGNALQAASVGGHEAVVRLLLENGTDYSHVRASG